MRPIDADAYGEKLYKMMPEIDEENSETCMRRQMTYFCLAVLNDMPTITPPPNDPLTLEELREMDGEPVWCAFSEDRGCYMIIQWHNSEFFKSFECGFLLAEEYGKSWLSYRRKPEEGTSVGS